METILLIDTHGLTAANLPIVRAVAETFCNDNKLVILLKASKGGKHETTKLLKTLAIPCASVDYVDYTDDFEITLLKEDVVNDYHKHGYYPIVISTNMQLLVNIGRQRGLAGGLYLAA